MKRVVIALLSAALLVGLGQVTATAGTPVEANSATTLIDRGGVVDYRKSGKKGNQKSKPAKGVVRLKCYLVTLNNEGTNKVVYGEGRTRGEAQNNANRKVPRGYKLKHCDEVR